MAKEIIINAEKEQTRIAILENGELVELFIENQENERTIGNIMLGKVRKIMPSIQAAFVDVGQKQDAFLHFSDLSDNLPELIEYLKDENPEIGSKPLAPVHRHAPSLQSRRRPSSRQRPEGAHGLNGGAEQPALAGEDGGSVVHSREEGNAGRGRRRPTRRPPPVTLPSAPTHADEDLTEPPPRRDLQPDHYLKRDQRLLVKIVKEPIASKGSRVSTDISLAGRFLVLVPLADYVAVSKKIVSPKERRRLRTLAKSLLPDGFGLIVRTVAEGKNAKALDTDLRLLVDKWRKIEQKLAGNPEPPVVVHEDVNMVSSVVRDLFSDDYDRILTDDPRLYRNLKNYVTAVAPHMVPAVQLHKGKDHIFEATGIARDFALAFESRVELPTGGYLFIERTEAMYVVDVNSGRSGRGMTQEENSLKVNLEAARIIARQVRLRDIGGIIVVDFIDLRDDRNRMKVYEELKKEFRKDRAVTKLLPMSDFGLIQITRQRLRPSFTVSTPESSNLNEPRPALPPREEERPQQGRDRERVRRPGKPESERQLPVEEVIHKMDDWIHNARENGKARHFVLRVHPFTAAYLNRSVPSQTIKWFLKYLVRVRIETDEKLAPMSWSFHDAQSGEDITRPPQQKLVRPSDTRPKT